MSEEIDPLVKRLRNAGKETTYLRMLTDDAASEIQRLRGEVERLKRGMKEIIDAPTWSTAIAARSLNPQGE